MRHSACVYPENAQEILSRTDSSIELELQSFGLKGVRSREAWDDRANFYTDFVQENPGRTYHLHGPFIDLTYYPYDHLIAEVVAQRLSDTSDVCRRVKPDHLVMHLNCPSYFCQETHFGQWVDAAAEFWKPFLEKLGQGGVHTVFENVMEPDPVAAVAFLEALEKYNVGFCLDIGHAHAFTDHEPVLWVEEMGERITHFHIHDNSGEDDEHMAPGRGSIDFDKLYSLIQQYCPDAVLSIEVDTGVDEVIHGLQTSKYFCDENI